MLDNSTIKIGTWLKTISRKPIFKRPLLYMYYLFESFVFQFAGKYCNYVTVWKKYKLYSFTIIDQSVCKMENKIKCC